MATRAHATPRSPTMALVCSLLAYGCTHAPAPAARGERLPSTQADPLPYSPPTGGPGKLTDDSDLAAAVGRRVAAALVSGDIITLRHLFAERVARTRTGSFTLRDTVLTACERDIARGTARSAGLAAFVALDRIRTVPSDRDRSRSGLSQADYDYMVFIPLLGTAGAQASPACLPTLFVQLRPQARVVGIE